MPTMLHNGNEACKKMSERELLEEWSQFKKKIKPIRTRYRDTETLIKRYSDLENREIRWDEACETCELPKLAHTVDEICRKDPNLELDAYWNAFRRTMESIKEGYKENMGNMKMENNSTQRIEEQDHRDQKRKCDLCENQYTNREELKEHEYEYHEQKCNKCEKRYVHIKELGEHYKKEHGITRYKCTDCRKEFENLEEMSEHQKNCYTCDLCNYGIGMNRRDFEDHIDMKHHKDCYTIELFAFERLIQIFYIIMFF